MSTFHHLTQVPSRSGSNTSTPSSKWKLQANAKATYNAGPLPTRQIQAVLTWLMSLGNQKHGEHMVNTWIYGSILRAVMGLTILASSSICIIIEFLDSLPGRVKQIGNHQHDHLGSSKVQNWWSHQLWLLVAKARSSWESSSTTHSAGKNRSSTVVSSKWVQSKHEACSSHDLARSGDDTPECWNWDTWRILESVSKWGRPTKKHCSG